MRVFVHTAPSRGFLRAVLSSTALFGIISVAHAQQAASPTVTLPTIVVSPTAVPTPVDQVASSITVITAEDLEREQRRSVPDALAKVPGLNIVQNGGAGGQTSIFLRGTNSNHVKVLVDGIDVSDPSNINRSFDFGNLPTGDIERIEVLRGPQSGLYGADAIGGVISIITKKGKGPLKATGTLEGGSFGTFNQTASLSGSHSIYNYALNIQHLHSNDTPVTPPNLLPPGQKAIGNYYDNVTESTKLGADLSPDFSVNFVGRHTDSILRYTGTSFLPPTFAGVPSAAQSTLKVEQYFARGEAVWSLFDGRFKNYFGVNYTDQWNSNRDPAAAPSISHGDRSKGDWRGVIDVMPGQTLVLGAESEKETMRTSTVTAANGNDAGYVELQSEWARRFFLTANVRHDENDRFGGATTYRFAPAVILPWTGTKLKASYGTGFKAPTLNQLFVDFLPTFVANRNLKPEESTGFDAGFEQPVFNNRARFGATYFHNDITNLVSTGVLTTVPFPVTTSINIGRAETQGVEAFLSFKLTDRIDVRTDYTFTEAIDAVTRLELLRRPKNKVSTAVSWAATDDLTISGSVLHVGEFIDANRDFSIPRLKASGYTVVNLAADYTLNKNAKLFARIDNLFDERYEEPTGFLRPGIGVFGGVRLTN